MLKKNNNDLNQNKLENSIVSLQLPEVYTNAVLTNMTPYEFEITLGLGINNYEGVRPVVNVRMSPQFAKEFTQLLQNNIKMF